MCRGFIRFRDVRNLMGFRGFRGFRGLRVQDKDEGSRGKVELARSGSRLLCYLERKGTECL